MNFVALEFTQREAERTELWASNLDDALHSLVEWSEGNPGSILYSTSTGWDRPVFREVGDATFCERLPLGGAVFLCVLTGSR